MSRSAKFLFGTKSIMTYMKAGPARRSDKIIRNFKRLRKVFVKSYGCQMNVYDSDRMTDLLAHEGYVAASTPDEADLVILNTCHIREKAAEKVYSELGRVRQLKRQAERAGRRMTVAVAGCVAQAEGEEIVRRAPVVDLVVGPQNYHRLPTLLAEAENGFKVGRHRISDRGQVRTPRAGNGSGDPGARRDGLRHGAGGLR